MTVRVLSSFSFGADQHEVEAALAAAVPSPSVFPHDIYSFLMKSLRDCDREVGDLFLFRFVSAMQLEFEATYARIESLSDLYDPERTPVEALQYVKWLVGFTSRLDDVTGGLSEAELRILISVAVRLWKFKGTDVAVATAVQAFSTYAARILDYFFFRVVVDEVEIGREELDFDPWLIDIEGLLPSVLPDSVTEILGPPAEIEFDLTALLGADEAVPHDIRIQYVPTKTIQVRSSFWNGSANVVRSTDLMGQSSPPSPLPDDYRVGVDPDEFVTDVRVVDDGTGVINRTLIEKLIGILRPNSERYNVRYLDFQDTFRDAFFWSVESGIATHDPDSGRVVMEDVVETEIATNFPNDTTWTEVHAAVQFQLRDEVAGEWFEFRFYHDGGQNFYAVKVDPKTKLVSLITVVGGVPSTLDSVTLPVFHLNVFYVLSVQTEDTGSGHQIKYFLDDNLLGTVVDTDHTAGKLAVAVAADQRAIVTFADLFQIPLDSTRIGP